MSELSTLRPVELRSVWKDEARNFTPWLAKNLDLLGEALGMDLKHEETEAPVGGFSLDILALDLAKNGRQVVIENQLGQSDHDHLGKLMTYAGEYDPDVVVWLAREFRSEHLAAIKWLNQRTDKCARIFAVAVKAWRIDDSKPAPTFTVVAAPSDWWTNDGRIECCRRTCRRSSPDRASVTLRREGAEGDRCPPQSSKLMRGGPHRLGWVRLPCAPATIVAQLTVPSFQALPGMTERYGNDGGRERSGRAGRLSAQSASITASANASVLAVPP